MKDISGERFCRLTAISINKTVNHKRYWNCLCDCGGTAVVRQDQLTTGKTRSCGCLSTEARRKQMLAFNQKHSSRKEKPDHDLRHDRWNPVKHDHPRLYRIWQSMKSRCYYQKNKCFHCYGGRGIQICEEWRVSFSTFADWALCHGYSEDLTIDRINVDGNYTPENCRWISNYEQQQNKRKRPPLSKQEAVSMTGVAAR